MNVPKLHIVTLNCHDLRNDEKRRKVFYYLRTLSVDIICLQETNTPAAEASHWTDLWAGPAVWSKHVGLLLAPQHTLKGSSLYENDRVVKAEVNVRGHTFQVVNMYAPADATERKRCFDRLEKLSFLFDPLSVAFLAGDWNCCPDPVDRDPPRAKSDHWPRLDPLISDYFDAALQGAADRYFTFHHYNKQSSARLDHVFFSTHLAACSFSTTLLETTFSDHKALCVRVTPPSFERPTLWRLNTSLLDRQDLRDSTERKLTEASGHWDVCKTLSLSTARDFANLASRERNAETHRLQRQ